MDWPKSDAWLTLNRGFIVKKGQFRQTGVSFMVNAHRVKPTYQKRNENGLNSINVQFLKQMSPRFQASFILCVRYGLINDELWLISGSLIQIWISVISRCYIGQIKKYERASLGYCLFTITEKHNQKTANDLKCCKM